MPFSISRSADREVVATVAAARSPASTADSAWECIDAAGAADPGTAQKIGPHSLGRRVAVVRRSHDVAVGRDRPRRSRCGWTSSLWTPVGARNRPPSVGRPADAAARTRDPVCARSRRAAAGRAAPSSARPDVRPRVLASKFAVARSVAALPRRHCSAAPIPTASGASPSSVSAAGWTDRMAAEDTDLGDEGCDQVRRA